MVSAIHQHDSVIGIYMAPPSWQKACFPTLNGAMPLVLRKNSLVSTWWKECRESGRFSLRSRIILAQTHRKGKRNIYIYFHISMTHWIFKHLRYCYNSLCGKLIEKHKVKWELVARSDPPRGQEVTSEVPRKEESVLSVGKILRQYGARHSQKLKEGQCRQRGQRKGEKNTCRDILERYVGARPHEPRRLSHRLNSF